MGSFDVAGALVRWADGARMGASVARPRPSPPSPWAGRGRSRAATGVRGSSPSRRRCRGWGRWRCRGAAGRTLFLERYLFFSQLALLVLLARRLGGTRALAAARDGAPLLGLVPRAGAGGRDRRAAGRTAVRPGGGAAPGPHRSARRTSCSPTRRATSTSSATTCIAKGRDHIAMKCPASRSVGHLSQVSSITSDEIVGEESVWAGPWPRVWRVRLHPPRKWRPDPPPADWTLVLHPGLRGARRDTRLLVTAYQRVTPSPPAIDHTP